MTRVQVYDPFSRNTLDQIVRGLFAPVRVDGAEAGLPIKVDVAETDSGYVVHADIPGVKKDEIQVTIEGNQVTIAAEVKRTNEVKDGERVLRSERYAGSVFRSFVLPVELDEAASEAKYDNGVLELKLAKKAPEAGRKLTVQ
jgi:HSP20 family protein